MSERVLDDTVLIARSQRGDRSAFDTLIARHQTRAYQYAFRLTRNQEEACDVVADAFVRIHNALPNFKGQSSFATWLYRILTNCFLDQRKKERNRTTVSLESALHTDEGDVERQVEDDAASPYDEMLRGEQRDGVVSAISSLPDHQRAIIVMYHIEDLSYEEIAAAMDLPVGTVKSRLNRARLSLREVLAASPELFNVV
jgi:RNA polymerase sigma-70 factor (ECF subfamily)